LRATRYRKLLIVTTALVFAAAAWLALKRLPNLYEASTLINVESKSAEADDAARRVNAIQQQLTNRATQANAQVSEAGANGLRISYRAADPATAAQAVNALANELVAEYSKPTAAASPAETETLRQRALELSARLREMEERSPWLLAIKDATPAAPRSATPSADALRAQQLTIESLKDRQYLIQQQLADIEQRIASVRQIVEQQKKGSGLRDNPTYAALIARRTELEGQRDTLVNRQELTDKHPRVAAIIDQIAAINRQIDELRQQDANQSSQSPEGRELRSLESERNRLKLELEINNRELARRSTVATAPPPSPAPARESAASSPAAQAYFGLKRSYEEAMARLDSAETKLSSVAPPSETLRVAEAAAVPQRPAGPPHWLLAVGAFGAGLALGILLAVVLESRRFATVQDARDVDLYTRLPLLAAIPKTVTDEERRLRSRRATIRLAVGAVVAVAATAALAAIFVATNIFSLISRS
jgi:capsular polysaccharide biosynthesis protein